MEYIVVASDFAVKTYQTRPEEGQSLKEQVQHLLDAGWKLQGGVSVGGTRGGYRYAQALVKD